MHCVQFLHCNYTVMQLSVLHDIMQSWNESDSLRLASPVELDLTKSTKSPSKKSRASSTSPVKKSQTSSTSLSPRIPEQEEIVMTPNKRKLTQSGLGGPSPKKLNPSEVEITEDVIDTWREMTGEELLQALEKQNVVAASDQRHVALSSQAPGKKAAVAEVNGAGDDCISLSDEPDVSAADYQHLRHQFR